MMEFIQKSVSLTIQFLLSLLKSLGTVVNFTQYLSTIKSYRSKRVVAILNDSCRSNENSFYSRLDCTPKCCIVEEML